MPKKKTTNKTTIKNFELFKEYAKKYLDIFGLKSWEVSFYHKNIGDPGIDDDSLSFILYSKDGSKTANICLNTDWGDEKISDERVKQCAFHEVMHLLLAPITMLAEDRYIADGAIEAEEHGLIRTFENSLFCDEL